MSLSVNQWTTRPASHTVTAGTDSSTLLTQSRNKQRVSYFYLFFYVMLFLNGMFSSRVSKSTIQPGFQSYQVHLGSHFPLAKTFCLTGRTENPSGSRPSWTGSNSFCEKDPCISCSSQNTGRGACGQTARLPYNHNYFFIPLVLRRHYKQIQKDQICVF